MRMRSSSTARISCGMVMGNGGSPTKTKCTPISSAGFSRARATASSNAAPVAMSVVAVRMPLRCASTIPRFTSRVKPKSSALTTSLRTSEQAELDAQELLGIGAEIFHQAVDFTRGAVEILIKRRIHQQLPERALAVVDFVQQRVKAAHGGLQLIMQIIAAEQLAGGAFTLLEAGQYSSQISDGGARIVVESGVFHQLADRAIALLDAVS